MRYIIPIEDSEVDVDDLKGQNIFLNFSHNEPPIGQIIGLVDVGYPKEDYAVFELYPNAPKGVADELLDLGSRFPDYELGFVYSSNREGDKMQVNYVTLVSPICKKEISK